MKDVSIAIAGGGPVGLALACALQDCGVRVIEAAAVRQAAAHPSAYDTRVYALSAGTREFLREVGAWDRLDLQRVAAVRRMEVFGDRGARLSFTGRPGGALAWMVEAGQLARALEEQAATLSQVVITRGTRVLGVESDAGGARIELANGERFAADLLVGADGVDSRVRTLLGLEAEDRPYEEAAVVANFDTEREHGEAARQWFGAGGVLAWLPLPGRRMSIVWSAPRAFAEELAALDAPALERRVAQAGGGVLGGLHLASAVATFPLRLLRVERVVVPGAALVGDAAHGVHPLAGQGVNLGFQDVRVLAAEIAARSPLERPGDLRLLRRYARARREDVTAMQFVTDGLDRLFADARPGAALARDAGMRLVQSQPWIKGLLAGRAMR